MTTERKSALDLLRSDCERVAELVRSKGYQKVCVHYRIAARPLRDGGYNGEWLTVGYAGATKDDFHFFYGDRMFDDALAWAEALDIHESVAAAKWFDLAVYDEAKVPA